MDFLFQQVLEIRRTLRDIFLHGKLELAWLAISNVTLWWGAWFLIFPAGQTTESARHYEAVFDGIPHWILGILFVGVGLVQVQTIILYKHRRLFSVLLSCGLWIAATILLLFSFPYSLATATAIAASMGNALVFFRIVHGYDSQ